MGGDPIFAHGLGWVVWVMLLVKTVIVFAIVLVSVLFMVMYERKAVARLGVRYGPNRAGPGGWLQSLADGVKLFFKEAFVPARADRVIYRLAPYLALVPAILVMAIVPFGGTITIDGHTTDLQLANPPWGILFFLMCSGVAVYGVMLAGWASGAKYSLLAAVRASAQMVSYEAVLGLSIATVVVVSGSLHTNDIVAAQHGGFLYHWNIIHTALFPFALYCVAATAEITRPPFDLVEAEEEISGGFNMEYSSIGFALFYLAEYGNLVVQSAIITTLWLGGPDGPRIAGHSIGPFWFSLKVLILLYVFVWMRATLPRLRYDQLM
ncbi:MAG: complex I subunit 1/NuoH family protein, partial [Actinomycetes bacterium]